MEETKSTYLLNAVEVIKFGFYFAMGFRLYNTLMDLLDEVLKSLINQGI